MTAPLLHSMSTPALARLYAALLDKGLEPAEPVADELARRLQLRRDELAANSPSGARRLSSTLARLADHVGGTLGTEAN